jgi:hypothetical protein
MINEIVTKETEFKGFDGKGWTCDECGEVIEKARDGWVEWLRAVGSEKKMGEGLRLVHHLPASPRKANGMACQYDGHAEYRKRNLMLADLPLASMIGSDGLMKLLALLAQDYLPKDEVLEMIKRLHIPGYESARLYMDEAQSQGVYEPNTFQGKFPHQSQIETINEWATKNK